ncbi:hypothetical protein [Nannocystis bainbridge]|uniref:Uncharacterized protein n=1 Tax=Nannocystis bainbridge TaxID=2995303 RepID=A0ABT5E5R5_9BACT|nr:hypothetical protein [Nannocystis bainbridge]MDC0720684.1 hypothetical protein [Nannocystis bainbridge]
MKKKPSWDEVRPGVWILGTDAAHVSIELTRAGRFNVSGRGGPAVELDAATFAEAAAAGERALLVEWPRLHRRLKRRRREQLALPAVLHTELVELAVEALLRMAHVDAFTPEE